MSEPYPKEVLETLERDHGITFKGKLRPPDARLCYGATCTWFGSIHETGKNGPLPCCPHCGGVLFEMADEGEWWAGVDRYEREQPWPGYRAMWEWQRAQKRCFSQRRGIDGLVTAWRAAVSESGGTT